MMAQAVKRACDACHRRKVKCDGINPCRNCSSAQLSCTYNAIPQKKGPKGSRAKVISELRETQRQTSLSAKVQNRMAGLSTGPVSNPAAAPAAGLLSVELVKDCLEFFFANMYTNMPILSRQHIEQQAMFSVMEQNRDAYCLITSLCAFVILQPGMSMPAGDPFNLDMMPGVNLIASTVLLEEALRVRRGYEYLDAPSLNTLATSYFLFACQDGIEAHNRAWYYLREASTIMHMLNMHKEETYMQWDAVESSRRRRLYWLVFATERAYAIKRQRPMTLQATINLPTLTDDATDLFAPQLGQFISTVTAFSHLDDAVVSAWNKTRAGLSAAHISSLQKQLNELLPGYLCQDSQLGDMNMNQEWLKSTAWQLSSGRLHNGEDPSLSSFQFPAEMARELEMTLASHFPNQGMEVMGSGLMEKLAEVTTATLTVLSQKPASRDPFSVGPRERLGQILEVVGVIRSGDYRFLPLLLSKVGDALPHLTNPMLQNAPENANLANIDIFDGFGNAGVAQPPQMHMAMDTDYDRKFPISEYEKKYNPEPSVSGGSTGAPSMTPASAADNTSPFSTSSPALMSPGVEFSHHVNDFGCAALPDMGMGGMGGQNAATINPQQTQQQQQQQQQQQAHSLSTLQSQCMSPQQMHGGMAHNLGQTPNMPQTPTGQIPTSHPSHASLPMGGGNSMLASMGRQPPQRANSYMQQQQPPIPRTIGDFHSLQRAASDMAGGMDMDFSGLR